MSQVTWKRKYWGWAPDEGWCILTNLPDLGSAVIAYKKRFGIEEMFRYFKKGGYNLEETSVTGERLEGNSFTNCHCLYDCYNAGKKN